MTITIDPEILNQQIELCDYMAAFDESEANQNLFDGLANMLSMIAHSMEIGEEIGIASYLS